MRSRRTMLAIVLRCAPRSPLSRPPPRALTGTAGSTATETQDGSIRRFPDTIKTVDLNGYEIVTAYPLGANTGNTFQQNYTDTGVTAFATAGPDLGSGNFVSTYTALPWSGTTSSSSRWCELDGSSEATCS